MSVTTPHIPSANGEPACEAAYMLPVHGSWSEEDFLKFHTNKMAELVDGRLEILPNPTLKHQRILRWILGKFEAAAPGGSITLFAPLPTRLFPGTIREPDLLYISPENAPGPDVEYPSHLDLALEVVSPGKDARQRDYVDKRVDYARAGISEYWIVDAQENQITVLVLRDGAYVEHGVFSGWRHGLGNPASGLAYRRSGDAECLMDLQAQPLPAFASDRPLPLAATGNVSGIHHCEQGRSRWRVPAAAAIA